MSERWGCLGWFCTKIMSKCRLEWEECGGTFHLVNLGVKNEAWSKKVRRRSRWGAVAMSRRESWSRWRSGGLDYIYIGSCEACNSITLWREKGGFLHLGSKKSKNESCSKLNLVSNEHKHDMIGGLRKNCKFSEMTNLPLHLLESSDKGFRGSEWPRHEHKSCRECCPLSNEIKNGVFQNLWIIPNLSQNYT